MAKKNSAPTLKVGDYVRLQSRAANQHQSFQLAPSELATQYEAVTGIVLSIRDVATGKLVAGATGALDGYVIELLNDRTFNPRYASARNAPRGTDTPTAAPAWDRLRQELHAAAQAGTFYTSAMPSLFTDSPLAKLLDGWKVLRVRSTAFELLDRLADETDEVA